MTRMDLRITGRWAVATTTVAAVSMLAATAASGAPAPVFPSQAVGAILQDGAPGAIRDSYIVVLRDSGAPAGRVVATTADELSRRYGGRVRAAYTSAVRGFSVRMPAAAARRLAANPAVAYVEQDRLVTVDAVQTNATWGLDRLDQRALPLSTSYSSTTAAGVTAYVIDSGIRTTHTDFGGRAFHGHDFIGSDAVAEDCNGHGTHVAGTIGGTAYGVAKNVKLVGVRVLDCAGNGSYSQIIAGVDWVTAHAVKPAVANMSLGGPASAALDGAVQRSMNAGIAYAVAAGNDNENACLQSPARAAAAITVGSSTRLDARSSFSNFGTCLDLFAPGSSITSAGKDSDTATATMSGTSMASPHVAGAAALVLGASPASTPAQVRDTLVSRATPDKVTNPGTGSPNRLLFTAAAATTAPVVAPVAPPACGPFTAGTNVPTRDITTVFSAMTIAGCVGKASATTSVEVHIKHTHRGSLLVYLVAPNGVRYSLKPSTTADTRDHLDARYVINASAVARNGTWRLQVRDAYLGNGGYLDSWTLRP